jgi:hypothetical protein
MAHTDARVDAYIERAQPFAKPVLEHLRAVVQAVHPDIAEAIKWGMPAFLYKGKILASMASFKAHATFGVWSGPEAEKGNDRAGEAMGSLGRITGLADLPGEAALRAMLARAMAVIDAGAPRAPKRTAKPELPVPPALTAALDANPAARATFDGFAPSHRREYVEWVAEAKREETRVRRIAQAVDWLAEGRKRNWKYENC